ncbi:MAG: hypothetical protein KA409_13490 [Ferruginibacter sp.]|nr:hypothetical protein [Ferruginibacter sp.]
MKLLNLSRQFMIAGMLVLLCYGCKKMEDDKARIKITGGGTPATIITIKTDRSINPATIVVAEIRREITNSSQLNKEITVQVKDNSAGVTIADPTFAVLPDSLYVVNAETPKSGGYYTVTLKPGEYAKSIRITIPNPTLLNPLFKYALGFTIESAGVNAEVSDQSSIVARITTNNRWDGVYLNIGNPAVPDHGFRDITSSAFTWYGDQEYSLVTIDATKCGVVNNQLGQPGYILNNAGLPTFFGSYGLVVEFDSITNSIVNIYNAQADLSLFWLMPANWDPIASCIIGPPIYASCNTRRAVLDPSGVNAVLPNKDIIIKHFMLQPSVVPVSPNIRCYFDETWKYLRPR